MHFERRGKPRALGKARRPEPLRDRIRVVNESRLLQRLEREKFGAQPLALTAGSLEARLHRQLLGAQRLRSLEGRGEGLRQLLGL